MPKSEKRTERHGGYRRRIRGNLSGFVSRYRDRSEENSLRGVARTANIRDTLEEYYPVKPAKKPGRAFVNGIFGNNPVLFNALGVVLIVGCASTVNNASLVALVAGVLMLVCEFMASVLYKRFPLAVRLAAYVLTAAAMLVGMSLLLFERYTAVVSSVSIYFPLICVTGLVTSRSEDYAIHNKPLFAVCDALGCAVGFGMVIIFVGALRELLTLGTLAGYDVNVTHIYPSANLAFFTFLVLALVCAIARQFRAAYRRAGQRNKQREEERQ